MVSVTDPYGCILDFIASDALVGKVSVNFCVIEGAKWSA
jgi:hypothetical protein